MATVTKVDKSVPPKGATPSQPAPAKTEAASGAAHLIAALGHSLVQQHAAPASSPAPAKEAAPQLSAPVPAFPACLKGAKKEQRDWNGLRVTFYAPEKPSDFSVIYGLFSELVGLMLKHTSTEILLRYKDYKKLDHAAVFLRPEALKEAVKAYVEQMRANPEKKGVIKEFNRAAEIFLQFLDHPTLYCNSYEKGPRLKLFVKDLEKEFKKAMEPAAFFFYEKLGMKNKTAVAFTKRDAAYFQMSETDKNASKLTCFEFAMLRMGEKKAQQFIFGTLPVEAEVKGKMNKKQKEAFAATEPLLNLAPHFKQWGYLPVEVPEPGDLAIYFDAEGEANHAAVYQSEGEVLSKLGILCPNSYTHPLFNVPSFYGSQVAFFRKPAAVVMAAVTAPPASGTAGEASAQKAQSAAAGALPAASAAGGLIAALGAPLNPNSAVVLLAAPSKEEEVDPALEFTTRERRIIDGQEVILFNGIGSDFSQTTQFVDDIFQLVQAALSQYAMQRSVSTKLPSKQSKHVSFSYDEIKEQVIRAYRFLQQRNGIFMGSGHAYDLLTKASLLIVEYLDAHKERVVLDAHEFETSFHRDFSHKVIQFIYPRLGMKVAQETIVFTKKVLKEFGIKERAWITQDPAQMSCVQFAFLKMGDVRLKLIIFKRLADSTKDPIHVLHRTLKAFKYQSVSQPQKGDLVVYHTADGKAQHTAVYLGGGMVESKPGIKSPSSYTHALFDVQHNYGNSVAFFRKPQE